MKFLEAAKYIKRLREAGASEPIYSEDGKVLRGVPYRLEDIEISKDATVIGSLAFEGCSRLKRINIPGNIKLIKNHAFYGCDLDLITIPAKTKIEPKAFEGCEVYHIQYGGSKEDWKRMKINLPNTVQTVYARDAGIRGLMYNSKD